MENFKSNIHSNNDKSAEFRHISNLLGITTLEQKAWAEFDAMASATQQVRGAFWNLSRFVEDNGITGRLSTAMSKVIQSDKLNPRGYRNVIDGDISLLEGFQFNEATPLRAVFTADYSCSVDRKTGQLAITIPTFTPEKMIKFPPEIKYFRITSGAAEIDFTKKGHIADITQTDILKRADKVYEPVILFNRVTPGTRNTLLVALGIEFYLHAKGNELKIGHPVFNTLQIVTAVN